MRDQNRGSPSHHDMDTERLLIIMALVIGSVHVGTMLVVGRRLREFVTVLREVNVIRNEQVWHEIIRLRALKDPLAARLDELRHLLDRVDRLEHAHLHLATEVERLARTQAGEIL